jgi:xanthine dehydrogenase accessory factor
MSDPFRGDPGVCGGSLEVYVEPVQPEPTIVVVGGGHVGRAVVSLAGWLGYRVVLSDDRAEFCSPEAVPGAGEYICCPLSELAGRLKITPFTYLILTTRNVGVDVEGLPELLDRPAAYIGVIGSKRRWQTAREKLIEMGVSEAKLDRIVSPMGLELNAETPEEIALSILAEIIMLRRGGDGGRMGGLRQKAGML